MPKYSYKCKDCEHVFEMVHSILMKLENCDACGSCGALFRIPSLSYSTKKETPVKSKTGSVVKEFIQDAKMEVEAQKQEMMEGVDK
jgi:putative FmdB family regulatory protein